MKKIMMTTLIMAVGMASISSADSNEVNGDERRDALESALAQTGRLGEIQTVTSEWALVGDEKMDPHEQAKLLLQYLIEQNQSTNPNFKVEIRAETAEYANVITDFSMVQDEASYSSLRAKSGGINFDIAHVLFFNIGKRKYERVNVNKSYQSTFSKYRQLVRYKIDFVRPISSYSEDEMITETNILASRFKKRVAGIRQALQELSTSGITGGQEFCLNGDATVFRNFESKLCKSKMPEKTILSKTSFNPGLSFAFDLHMTSGGNVLYPERRFITFYAPHDEILSRSDLRAGINGFKTLIAGTLQKYRNEAQDAYDSLISTGVAQRFASRVIKQYKTDLALVCNQVRSGHFRFQLFLPEKGTSETVELYTQSQCDVLEGEPVDAP